MSFTLRMLGHTSMCTYRNYSYKIQWSIEKFDGRWFEYIEDGVAHSKKWFGHMERVSRFKIWKWLDINHSTQNIRWCDVFG